LGIAADLSDASGLVVPILDTVSPSPTLRIAGSNTVLGDEIGVAAQWREDFQDQRAWQVKIPFIGEIPRTVNVSIEGVGSIRGFEMAREGKVDLLVASEPMSEDERDKIVAAGYSVDCAAVIGYDVMAFVTNMNNRVPEVEKRDMKSVLRGSLTDWSQLGGEPGPIRILARHGSGTTELILQRFTGSTGIPGHFVTTSPPCERGDDDPANGCSPCGSNEECLDLALVMPGSLYWVSAAWLQTQPPRYLRLIRIPYEGRLEYPLLPKCAEKLPGEEEDEAACFDPHFYEPDLIRPLYMYVLGGDGIDEASTALAQEFLEYVRGLRGQEILEAHSFYTHFAPPTEVDIVSLPGFEPREDGTPVVCRE
jgi:ABC-type phosphate transport system substrate-binding protein